MSTLADLYDPLTMPTAMAKAHASLDKAVERCYLAKASILTAMREHCSVATPPPQENRPLPISLVTGHKRITGELPSSRSSESYP